MLGWFGGNLLQSAYQSIRTYCQLPRNNSLARSQIIKKPEIHSIDIEKKELGIKETINVEIQIINENRRRTWWAREVET